MHADFNRVAGRSGSACRTRARRLQSSFPRGPGFSSVWPLGDFQAMAIDRITVRGARQHNLKDISVDRKSTRLNSSHANISYAVFCLKKKNTPILEEVIRSFLCSSSSLLFILL